MADFEKKEFKFPHESAEQAEEKVEFEVEGEEKPEVEVVDDTPPEDRGRTPMADPPEEVPEDELKNYSEGVRKRIQHFTKGYHDERRAKEAALREREEAIRLAEKLVEENKRLQGSVGQSQQALLEQAKRVVTNELENAKRKYKEAYEAGDSDALVAAQEELTAAKIKADRVNNFKPAPVQQKQTVVQTQPQEQQTQPKQVVDPKARAWQEANPWFGTDDDMTAVALVAHKKLVESGVDTTSDEYYSRINNKMREVFPSAFPSEKQKKSNVVAPATRSTAPKKIVLTQSQVNIAKRLGVPLDVYARQVAQERMKENG